MYEDGAISGTMTTEAGDSLRKSNYRQIPIPRIACKVKQDNSGLINRLAALEKRIYTNETKLGGMSAASPARESNVLAAILQRLDALEQQGSNSSATEQRLDALENPAFDPLIDIRLRLESLEDGSPGIAEAAAGASEAIVEGEEGEVGEDVTAVEGGLMSKELQDQCQKAVKVSKQAFKQAEAAAKQSADLKKELKTTNVALAELKSEMKKVKSATPTSPTEKAAASDSMSSKWEEQAEAITGTLQSLQQRVQAVELELGYEVPAVLEGAQPTAPAANITRTINTTLTDNPLPVSNPSPSIQSSRASRSSTIVSRPGTSGEFDRSSPEEQPTEATPVQSAASSRVSTANNQKSSAELCKPSTADGQMVSPLSSPGSGGLPARVSAIEEACALFVLRADSNLVWRKEFRDLMEEQKQAMVSKFKEFQKDIVSKMNVMKKRGVGSMGVSDGADGEGGGGNRGGGADAEELAMIAETVDELRARVSRTDKLGKQMLTSMESLSSDMEHKLKAKCSMEEFKNSLFSVNQALADTNRDATIAKHERKEIHAAIAEFERVLNILRSGMEAVEASVQLGGSVTQEDLAKITRRFSAEHAADSEQLRSGIQTAESRLDTKLNRMYNELGQLNKLTQLWGTMLQGGDSEGTRSFHDTSHQQREALNSDLVELRIERLETETRALVDARDESMALLRSTVGDLRDTKVRVTSLRDISNTHAPKDQLEKVKKYADSLRRMIKEKASAADLETTNTTLKRVATELHEAISTLGSLGGKFEANCLENERQVTISSDQLRSIETRVTDAAGKLEELTERVDEMPDPLLQEQLSNDWSTMVAEAGGQPHQQCFNKGYDSSEGRCGGELNEEYRRMVEAQEHQLRVNSEIDQRNFEKFSMWLTKHDKKLEALRDKVEGQAAQITMALSHADAMQTQQICSLASTVSSFAEDMSHMRKQHMALSFTVSMDRKVASRREESLFAFEQWARGAVNSCVQVPAFESHVAQVMSVKADAAEVKALRADAEEQFGLLLDKSRAAEQVQELVERLEPALRFRARDVQSGYNGSTLAQHIAVLLDATSVQTRKLSDVATGVARISAQQREVSAEKMMELVQDGIEVALAGMADKVYDCVSISETNKQLTQDLSAAVLAMGLDPTEEAKLLDCSGAKGSSKSSSAAHMNVLQALYKPISDGKRGSAFSMYAAKLALVEQNQRGSENQLENSEWLQLLNSTREQEEPASPRNQLVGGALVRKLAAMQQEPTSSEQCLERNGPLQHKANKAELVAVAQQNKDLLVASDRAIEDLWQSVEAIEHKITHLATADVISHKVDREELLHLLDEIVQAYERKLTGGDGESLLSMKSPGAPKDPNCALCSKPLNAFHAAVGECVRHGKFPPRLPIKQERLPTRPDRVELNTASGARVVLPKELYERKMYAANVEISARKQSPRRDERQSPRRGLATREQQLQQTYGKTLEQTGDYIDELPSIIQAHTHR